MPPFWSTYDEFEVIIHVLCYDMKHVLFITMWSHADGILKTICNILVILIFLFPISKFEKRNNNKKKILIKKIKKIT